jgi:hypothetical protein
VELCSFAETNLVDTVRVMMSTEITVERVVSLFRVSDLLFDIEIRIPTGGGIPRGVKQLLRYFEQCEMLEYVDRLYTEGMFSNPTDRLDPGGMYRIQCARIHGRLTGEAYSTYLQLHGYLHLGAEGLLVAYGLCMSYFPPDTWVTSCDVETVLPRLHDGNLALPSIMVREDGGVLLDYSLFAYPLLQSETVLLVKRVEK